MEMSVITMETHSDSPGPAKAIMWGQRGHSLVAPFPQGAVSESVESPQEAESSVLEPWVHELASQEGV